MTRTAVFRPTCQLTKYAAHTIQYGRIKPSFVNAAMHVVSRSIKCWLSIDVYTPREIYST